MAMKGFMSRLRNQIGFHLKDNPHKDSDSDDEEEDIMYEDFVMVEERQKTKNKADELPSYTQVMRESSQNHPQVSTPPTVTSSMCKSSSQTFDPVSPMDGVPFQLHSKLCSKHYLQQLFYNVDLQIHDFNSERYSYDFKQEKLYLEEHK